MASAPGAPIVSPALRRSALAVLALALLIPASRILGSTPIYGDDHSSHLATIAHLAALLRAGESDFFCPTFNLGFPMYLYYQPLPHFAVALAHLASGGLLGLELVFNASVVALWCCYPLAVYSGARRLELGADAALAAALAAPLVSSSLPFGFTLHSVMGLGLYTQLWAMVLLPLALGWSWQALASPRARAGVLCAAAGLHVVVWLSHAFYGVAAATAAALMALVAPAGWRKGLPRLAAIGALVVASVAFWLLPAALTSDFAGGWPWDGLDRWQGYGARRALAELASGQLFDRERLPLLSLALVAGLLGAARRWREQTAPRALALAFVAFLAFLIGRRSLGHLVDVQPANLGLQLFRYLGPLHLSGVLLAGVALATGARWLAARSGRAAWALVVALAALAPPTVQLVLRELALFRTSASYDIGQAELRAAGAAIVRARAPAGRVYAHDKTGLGAHLVAALIARHTPLALGQSYGVSMHDSLGFYYLELLDPRDRAALALYNFRFVLARRGSSWARARAAAGARPLARQGPLEVHLVEGDHRFFQPGELAGVIIGRPREVRPAVQRWLGTGEAAAARFHLIVPWARPSRPLSLAAGPVGRLLAEETAPNRYRARVRFDRAGVLALKVGFHPFWRATLDSAPTEVLHLAPTFLGARVPAGEHDIAFRFGNPLYQKALFALALLLWLAAGIGILVHRYLPRPGTG